MNQIAILASGVYSTEFDSDANANSLTSISGWFRENLGLLNTFINTSFSGENPNMGLEEMAIYKELYLYNFYTKQVRNVLRGVTATTNAGDNILQVSDGDNSISFVNRNEVSKVYKDLAKESKINLDTMVAKYNIYGAKPLQVGGYEDTSVIADEVSTIEGSSDQPPSDGIYDAGEDV